MRKYIILILFVILSCQPEELMIVEPLPQYEMIFEESESSVTDGQEFSFEIISEEEHHIAKESFLPTLELNTRKLYTKSLPNDLLKLELINSSGVIKNTFIQIY